MVYTHTTAVYTAVQEEFPYSHGNLHSRPRREAQILSISNTPHDLAAPTSDPQYLNIFLLHHHKHRKCSMYMYNTYMYMYIYVHVCTLLFKNINLPCMHIHVHVSILCMYMYMYVWLAKTIG